MWRNPLKHALADGRPQFGLWQALASPYTAELCAGAGHDWLLFDGEHAPNDIRSMLAQLQAVAPYPSHPVARLPVAEPWIVKQYLDIGFKSLMAPMIDTAEQARALVAAAIYPPSGVRGVGAGLSRAAQWGRRSGYVPSADAEISLIAQVETTRGLSELDDIAATPGIDAIFLGMADLAADMGYPGQTEHPDVALAVDLAIGRIRAAGKAAGLMALDAGAVARRLGQGVTLLAVATDVALLRCGAEDTIRSARRVAAETPGPGILHG